MISLIGTYQNGYLKLDEEYVTSRPVKVIVTFLEEVESQPKPKKPKPGVAAADFSFAQSRENLQSFEGSFSEAVVAERRAEL